MTFGISFSSSACCLPRGFRTAFSLTFLLFRCELPLCVRRCLFNSSLRLKLFPQPGNVHWCGFSPVCVRICLFLCSKRWKPRLQTSHLKGLSSLSGRKSMLFLFIFKLSKVSSSTILSSRYAKVLTILKKYLGYVYTIFVDTRLTSVGPTSVMKKTMFLHHLYTLP